MEIAVLLAVLVLFLIIWAASLNRLDRAAEVVRTWATGNNMDVLELERRDFFRGPFFWRSGKTQVVFFLVVRDHDGRRREGYVRIGSFWSGALTEESIQAEWQN